MRAPETIYLAYQKRVSVKLRVLSHSYLVHGTWYQLAYSRDGGCLLCDLTDLTFELDGAEKVP